ncbi:MAG: hypothetical protein ACK56I_26875, partial [bacterium]
MVGGTVVEAHDDVAPAGGDLHAAPLAIGGEHVGRGRARGGIAHADRGAGGDEGRIRRHGAAAIGQGDEVGGQVWRGFVGDPQHGIGRAQEADISGARRLGQDRNAAPQPAACQQRRRRPCPPNRHAFPPR